MNDNTTHKSRIVYSNVSVKGIYYHRYAYNRFVKANLPLTARYEPNNEHDKNAIAVYGGNKHIGYIPREIAYLISLLPKNKKEQLAIYEVSRDELSCVLHLYFSSDPKANYIKPPKTIFERYFLPFVIFSVLVGILNIYLLFASQG